MGDFLKHKFVPFLFVCGAFALPAAGTLFLHTRQTAAPDIFASGIDVYMNQGSLISCMDLDEYLIGVVAASIDPDCRPETLKAQAVIARTNAAVVLGSRTSVNASELNQPYLGPAALKSRFGADFNAVYEKYKSAVCAVSGEILTYEGEPASAPFFKCGTGKSRTAEAVFGTPIAYLTSVESPKELECPDLEQTTSISCEDFISRMLTFDRNFFATPESLSDTVQILETDDAGYVLTIQAGNLSMSGDDFRYLFRLPSAAFTIKIANGTVAFTSRGTGHGVGFSQYGADMMAGEGKTYKELLAYYYPGTVLQ